MLRASGNITRIGGNFLTITQDKDIVLTITVNGSYFPARQSPSINSFFRVLATPGVSNKVFINYNDGTGEHTYAMRSSGSQYGVYFQSMANQMNPATVSGTTILDVRPASDPPYGLHFFQDLPAGIKNTVNNEYNQERTITIRFEKPQNIINIQFGRVLLFGTFPSAISKLRNLSVFQVNNSRNITNFLTDFYNTNITNLSLSFFGLSLDNGFPNWILNSPIVTLDLSDSILLTGSPVTKRFDQINRLKNTLENLSLRSVAIDYTFPNEFNQLSKLSMFDLQGSNSPNMRFPENVSGLLALNNISLRGTRMPFAEIERLISSLPNSSVALNILDCLYQTDYNIANDNYTITNINIGYQRWNNGVVPSFISKLKALTVLNLQGAVGFSASNLFTSYGDFSACVNLTTLNIYRQGVFTTELPTWLNKLTKLKTLNMSATFWTVERTNAYVNNMYAFVVANAAMTGSASLQFRGMNVDIYAGETANTSRPSGTFQQPAGYAQGSNNGNPATPMEKLWVLTNQYSHVWTVKPL